jgi:putative FmdB family regulatory protein
LSSVPDWQAAEAKGREEFMPTYEYRCEACGHQFEHFQSISSPRLEVCPKCSKKKLNRLIGTGAGIIFKGSGFYATDYRSDSYNKAKAADHGGSASSSSTSSASKSSSEAAKSKSKSDSKKPTAA